MSPAKTGSPLISAGAVISIASGLREIGIGIERALRDADLDLEALASREEVPVSVLNGFWEALERSTGRSGLGIRLAEQLTPQSFDMLGELLTTSPNLGEALLRGTRLARLVTRTLRVSLHIDGETVTLRFDPLYPGVLHPESVELLLAAALGFGRLLTGEHLVPQEVHFSHERPADASEHERFFEAPLRFGMPHSGGVFESSVLALPVRGSADGAGEDPTRRAEAMVAQIADSEPLITRVRSEIEAQLAEGEPTLARVSESLALHPKSLRRRLSASGARFSALVDSIRFSRAQEQLTHGSRSVGEIALLLGYSEKSAFNRAFRRWAGCSPQEFRARHQAEGRRTD